MPDETQLRRRDLINLVLEDLREYMNSRLPMTQWMPSKKPQVFRAAVSKQDD